MVAQSAPLDGLSDFSQAKVTNDRDFHEARRRITCTELAQAELLNAYGHDSPMSQRLELRSWVGFLVQRVMFSVVKCLPNMANSFFG